MGAWRLGLWSDDTASDVRTPYREALEDGLSDEDATEKVLAEFAAELEDQDTSPVVWLALAGSPHDRGRPAGEVRDPAPEGNRQRADPPARAGRPPPDPGTPAPGPGQRR